MNEKFHNSIKKAGENISLTPTERERMRTVLHAYMEMKPIRAQQARVSSTSWNWFLTFRPVAAILVLALFASSAGVSYAAEDALPGDVLYAVKTRINEPVRGALAVSASAKATWATDVAGERVKEAATLAAAGRLSTTTQQELQADFEAHAQEATEAIGLQATTTPDEGIESAVRFEAQLSEYENVLAQVGNAKGVDVASLVSSVQAEGQRIAMIRARTESHIALSSDQGSATARMRVAARQQLDDSSELANTEGGSLSASSAGLVAAQLESASTSISAGEDLAGRNATPDALGAFQNALATAEKLGVFLKTSSAIHAHTGLVVAEPKTESTTLRVKHVAGPIQKSGKQAALMAATFSSPTTSEATTSETTTVNTHNDNAEEGDTSVETDTEIKAKQEVPSLNQNILPVSVPTHISL